MQLITVDRSRQGMGVEPTFDAADISGRRGGEETPIVAYAISVLRRRKWILIGAVAAALFAGILVTLLMTPKYTATALLEIQREDRNVVEIEGATPRAGMVDQEFYETQYGLLRSQTLAERVARSLRLDQSPEFFQTMRVPVPEDWFHNGMPTPQYRDERVRVAGELLLKSLTVEPGRLSRLVRVYFTSPDAALSQKVADAWGKNFIQLTLERRFEATSYARNFLEDRLNQLRGRIDESERRLVDYASRQGIVNLPSEGSSNGTESRSERSLLVDDLATLNQELSKATADRVRAESRLGSSGSAVTEALDNQAISGLRQKRAELSSDYAKLLVQFKPDYPPAQGLKTQIDQLDRAISREEGRVTQTLGGTYQSAVGRENALRRKVNELTGRVLDLRRRSIQYNIYQRDVDTNRQLYDALLQRYKAIGVAGGVGVNNIAIVDGAKLPEKPSSPKLTLNLLLAILAGLGIGTLAIFLIEQIDQGVSDPAEVEKRLGVPLIGTIPRTSKDIYDQLRDPKSALGEAYLSLRTNLAFATDHGMPRTIAVTSSRPAEGKSTTSFALALSLARSGRRVLLMDGDMRSPSVHHMFGIENEAGLSNILAGAAQYPELLKEVGIENLAVLTAGPHPPSAPELLASARFPELLKDLLDRFDNVVLDIPPVMGLADAPLVGSRVEGTIFVLEFGATQMGTAGVALERLHGANAMVVGCVLTKFNAKRANLGYGYDYGYGYGDNVKRSETAG
ncbi:GumC family protein [Sphingomonas tabacisoli]|uniref:non-specific protein-tyrosine kinase n=1 Tax=Sphingomonas tabacisoli TaxID=2249466 RepID=A0ABW4I535_9SPHN